MTRPGEAFAGPALTPNRRALAKSARVLAQQSAGRAQTTQVMIAQHIAQVAVCATSLPPNSPAPIGKIVVSRPAGH